jgi:hypothetical protein
MITELLEKFEDVFQPAFDDEVQKRIDDWLENLDESEVTDTLRDHLFNIDVHELVDEYENKTNITLGDLIVDDFMEKLDMQDQREFLRELAEDGSLVEP